MDKAITGITAKIAHTAVIMRTESLSVNQEHLKTLSTFNAYDV